MPVLNPQTRRPAAPRGEGDISGLIAPSPLLFYFEQTYTEFRARLGGPILSVGYPPPLRARQAAPWGHGCTAAHDDPLLLATKVSGRADGRVPATHGRKTVGILWEFCGNSVGILVIGTRGPLSSLAADPLRS